MKLIIGLSGNLPKSISGNSFDEDYQSFYRPFFQILYEYAEIPAVVYFSGVWFEWFEKNHPEFITFLSEMTKKRKQIEFLGGGYYEPILSLIRYQDRVGQMEALNTIIRQNFGRRPRGCGPVVGRYWDNSLIHTMCSAGIEYTFLDKSSLFNIGYSKTSEYGVSITEEQGKTLMIFPLANDLIKKIPQFSPEEFCGLLSGIKEEDSVVSLFFDAEILKQMGFPWLIGFFKMISADKNIEIMIPSHFMKSDSIVTKEFFASRSFLKRFIFESEEFSNLYSKMIFVQTLVNQIRGDKYKKKNALEELWRGEGYFSFFSRKACRKAYASFIEAEKLTREKGVFLSSLMKVNFRLEKEDQYLYQSENYNAYIKTEGASLFEFDSNIHPVWNYVSLEKRGAAGGGFFSDFLIGDKLTRGEEPFLPSKDPSLSLSDADFEVAEYSREKKSVKFLCRKKTDDFSLKVIKSYRFFEKDVEVSYEVINTGSSDLGHDFASFFDIVLPLNEAPPVIGENSIKIKDKNKTISITSSSGCSFTSETAADEEGGFVSLSVTAVWDTAGLAPGKSWLNKVRFSCRQ